MKCFLLNKFVSRHKFPHSLIPREIRLRIRNSKRLFEEVIFVPPPQSYPVKYNHASRLTERYR